MEIRTNKYEDYRREIVEMIKRGSVKNYGLGITLLREDFVKFATNMANDGIDLFEATLEEVPSRFFKKAILGSTGKFTRERIIDDAINEYTTWCLKYLPKHKLLSLLKEHSDIVNDYIF